MILEITEGLSMEGNKPKSRGIIIVAENHNNMSNEELLMEIAKISVTTSRQVGDGMKIEPYFYIEHQKNLLQAIEASLNFEYY